MKDLIKTKPDSLTESGATGNQHYKYTILLLITRDLNKKYENMKFVDFEKIVSSKRMSRYLAACNGDTRKAMTLYRYNLRLSQEAFTIVSCF